MLNVSEATKMEYKDYGQSRNIQIKIYADNLITLTNDDIAINTLSVEEILEPTENLTFTGCNASILKFKSINALGDIEGKKVEVTIQTGNTDIIPLFSGYIDSAKNTSYERVSMDIVAYDELYQINNTDYKSWYDTLFVGHDYITLKDLRDNFFTRIGIEQENVALPNDGMTIYKTIEDQNLTGGNILRWICQINGRYGRIGRYGKFQYVGLEGRGLYPSMTLYPSSTLFPSMSSSDEIGSAYYKLDSIEFEKYRVANIDGVQLIGKDNQVIASAGKDTKVNIFNVSGNPFIYNKTPEDLEDIAENLYFAINACSYTPLKLDMVGLPYVECGDYFSVVVKDMMLNTIILHRTLAGEQALTDNIDNNGNKYQPVFVPNTEDKINEAVQKSRAIADEEITNYDIAVRRMNDLAARSLGTYTDYEDPITGGRIYYMSNMPITKIDGVCHFDDLSIAYKIDGVGFYVSRPVGLPGSERVWEDGYDAQTGELVINVLDAVGIHADWVKTGLLADENYDPNNPYASNFWNLATGDFSLRAGTKVGGSTVQQIADASSSAAQSRAEATAAANLATAVASIDSDISDLQDQIDGNVTTWYYSGVPTLSNLPASQWTTTTDKDNHIGDIYYDSTTGYAYRFMKDGNNYVWTKISDSDIEAALREAEGAYDLADHKRRVFVSTPVPPYDIGDLWVQGSGGDILRCATAKTGSQVYQSSDWVLASNYVDIDDVTTSINAYDGTLTQQKVYNRLTNNSQSEGIYLQNGHLYLNASMIGAGKINANILQGGQFILGGEDNYSGVLYSMDIDIGATAYNVTISSGSTVIFLPSEDATASKYYITIKVPSSATAVVTYSIAGYSGQLDSGMNVLPLIVTPNPSLTLTNDSSGDVVLDCVCTVPSLQINKDGIESVFGKFGDFTIENSDIHATGQYKLYMNKSISVTKSAKETNLYTFTPYDLYIKDSSWHVTIKYKSTEQHLRPMQLSVQRYSNGSYTTVETVNLRKGDTDEHIYQLQTWFNNDDAVKYRFRLSIVASSTTSNFSFQYSFYIENATTVALTNEGIWGNLHGTIYGKANLDSAKIGMFSIDNTELSAIDSTDTNKRIILDFNGLSLERSGGEYVMVKPTEIDKVANSITYHPTWTTSDIRVKEAITDLSMELSKKLIEATETHIFKYKGSEGTHYGMIAQEARKLLDDLGETDACLEHSMNLSVKKTGIDDQRTIDYQEYIPHLINYVKDLKKEIAELKEEIKLLKGEK